MREGDESPVLGLWCQGGVSVVVVDHLVVRQVSGRCGGGFGSGGDSGGDGGDSGGSAGDSGGSAGGSGGSGGLTSGQPG